MRGATMAAAGETNTTATFEERPRKATDYKYKQATRTTPTTMAMEIAYKKFMTAASGWYKRSLAKELNKMGEC